MTIKHLILAGAAMVALTACSEQNNGTTDANVAVDSTDAEGTAPAATAASEGATAFVNSIAASDQFEIESGNAAAAGATSAEVKSFGTMLVTEHQKSTADLKAAAGPDLALTPTLNGEQTAMLTALKAAKGAAFDKLFLEQQAAAHGKTHGLLTSYSASGDNAGLRAFADKTAPVVKMHLDKAEALAGALR